MEQEYVFGVEFGHDDCRRFLFTSSVDVETIREAYKKSCALVGVQFHWEQDLTTLYKKSPYDKRDKRSDEFENHNRELTVFCQSYDPSDAAMDKLEKFGISIDLDRVCEEKYVAEIWTEFIKLSLKEEDTLFGSQNGSSNNAVSSYKSYPNIKNKDFPYVFAEGFNGLVPDEDED